MKDWWRARWRMWVVVEPSLCCGEHGRMSEERRVKIRIELANMLP